MSATVAAALKKIAVALLSDNKTRHKIIVFILSCIAAVFMPIAVVLAAFSGEIEFTPEQLEEIAENIDVAEIAKLTQIQETLDEIESAMEDADMDDRYEEAQILYILALYEYQDEDDFVDRLVGCFEEDQTDQELIEAINDEFDCDIDPVDYLRVVTGMRRTTISTLGYWDTSTKNNRDLVFWAWEAYNDEWGYVWGTYGQLLTQGSFESLCALYPNNVENHHDFIQDNWVGRRTADCAGLIKGYLWFNPDTHQIEYGSNGFSDVDADTMYNNSAVNGTIDTIPETPGLGVWHEGHVGIYIGDGWVIQASGTETGVIKSRLEGSSFTNWFEIPGITYITEDDDSAEEITETAEDTASETILETTEATEETTAESTPTETEISSETTEIESLDG